MPSSRAKVLFLPVYGLLLALLVLFLVLVVTTYISLRDGQGQARHILEAQGASIARGLAAGLRTGWRHWVWRIDSLQGLVEEMSQAGDVRFIALLDAEGRIIAHSDPDRLGAFFSSPERIEERLAPNTGQGWFSENDDYLYGYYLKPPRIPPEGRKPPRLSRPFNPPEKQPRPEKIMVGLDTALYRDSRKQQYIHTLVMSGLLFLVGSGAIYFIFVSQNYRTIDRTLTDLSGYVAGIVENMPNGLISFNQSGRPVMINRAARELFEWADQPESELAGEAVIKALYQTFKPQLAGQTRILEQEFNTWDRSGEPLPLAVSTSVVPDWASDESGQGLVFILRDLRQIRDLEDQVRQSEKLAAVGRLAAGVAHEVRNPLSSMRGLANFLTRSFQEKSREAQYLKVMVDEIDRLNRVINGLLDYARPRRPNLEEIRINDVARHTIDLVADDAGHQDIDLVPDLDPSDPVVTADRDMMVQAVLNVFLNAIEAMPNGGRMGVQTSFKNGLGQITVEDTGPGIPPDDRHRLSDPFFTTKDKGTGLGLAQVAAIMEAHHGRLAIGGQPGQGAVITLIFPENRIHA